MYDISIQIVNYNTKKFLIPLLEDVKRDLSKTNIHYCVCVLDNHSSDNLSDLEMKFTDTSFYFYKSSENLGFGAGHNFLSKKQKSLYIAILNPDMRLIQPDTFTRLLKRKEREDADVQVLGPRLETLGRKTQVDDHGEIKGLIARFVSDRGGSVWRDRTEYGEVAWVSGAFFLIRSDVYKRFQGFDERIFLYGEEEDLCLRIRRSGGKVMYDPTVSVLHVGSVVAKKNEIEESARSYYLEKNFQHLFGYPIYQLINKTFMRWKHRNH